MARELLLIYNADSTFMGKVNYTYRKLTKETPACAACDITNGGLSLKHTPEWTRVKQQIESQGWTVKELHRDELEESVKAWTKGYRLPILASKTSDMKLVMDAEELEDCGGSPDRFFEMLRGKDVVKASL